MILHPSVGSEVAVQDGSAKCRLPKDVLTKEPRFRHSQSLLLLEPTVQWGEADSKLESVTCFMGRLEQCAGRVWFRGLMG